MAWRSRREGTAPVRWPTAKRRNRRPTQPPTDRAGGRNHWRCLRLPPPPPHPYKPADSFSPPPTSEEAAMRRTPIRGSRAVCGGEGADGGGAVRLVGEGQGRLAGQQEDDEPEGQNGSGKITAWGCDVFGGHPGPQTVSCWAGSETRLAGELLGAPSRPRVATATTTARAATTKKVRLCKMTLSGAACRRRSPLLVALKVAWVMAAIRMLRPVE